MIRHGVGCAGADLFGVSNCSECPARDCGVVKELDDALEKISDLESTIEDLKTDIKQLEESQ